MGCAVALGDGWTLPPRCTGHGRLREVMQLSTLHTGRESPTTFSPDNGHDSRRSALASQYMHRVAQRKNDGDWRGDLSTSRQGNAWCYTWLSMGLSMGLSPPISAHVPSTSTAPASAMALEDIICTFMPDILDLRNHRKHVFLHALSVARWADFLGHLGALSTALHSPFVADVEC